MLPTILFCAVCGLIGAWLRYDLRKKAQAWVLTAVLAAVSAALLFLMPRGQELWSIWGAIAGAGALGSLICGACLWQCGRGR